MAAELEPIEWDTHSAKGARLEVTPQAGSVPAFRLLREVAAVDEFPEIIAFPAISKPKTLAATFSVSADQAPAVIYRRYGNGQTLSLGVGNLWRWVFNPKAEYDNNAYDRFWDQLTLWLLANGGVTPLEGYSLRADTSNLPLGETIRLRFGVHGIEPPATPPSVALFKDDAPVTTLTFTAVENDPIVSRRIHTTRNRALSRAGGHRRWQNDGHTVHGFPRGHGDHRNRDGSRLPRTTRQSLRRPDDRSIGDRQDGRGPAARLRGTGTTHPPHPALGPLVDLLAFFVSCSARSGMLAGAGD